MAVVATERGLHTTDRGLPVHRIEAEVWDRMVESGALEGQRVELLDGIITTLEPQSAEHIWPINVLARHFNSAEAFVWVQSTLALPGAFRPEPDIAIVPAGDYRHQHPTTALLVIEVAVSSHQVDRGVKQELYASAGIPEFWIVDVPGKAVEVRTDPSDGVYRTLNTYTSGTIPVSISGVAALDVTELF